MNVMLGALFITGVPAALLFIATVYAGHKLKHPNIGVVVGTILGMGIVIVFLLPAGNWYVESATKEYLDVDPLDSPPWIRELIEEHAERIDDFCYQRSPYYPAKAEFNMSPDDFLEWTASQGWEPREFHRDDSGRLVWNNPDQSGSSSFSADDTVYPLRNGEGRVAKEIEHAYLYAKHDQDDNSFLTVVYDIEEERVYVSKGWT